MTVVRYARKILRVLDAIVVHQKEILWTIARIERAMAEPEHPAATLRLVLGKPVNQFRTSTL
jgi:hypothetical protein